MVALLLSGGVDSAVALHVLCAEGRKPDCFYIRIGPEDTPGEQWDCSAEEDLEMCRALCRRYGCRLEIVDCHREYWDRVTTYTMEKVRQGLTPNPDVMCNRLIKFGAFHEKRGHDYALIATGHYATTELDEQGRTWLCTSPDPVKDQTDFLAQIHSWQLRKALFPIGYMLKDEVRRMAHEQHLVNAARHDSQGICFLGKVNYNDYLRRYLGERPGPAIELETGRVVGQHRGHWFCTIGQRKGLGFGGGPWFVVKKDVETNTVWLSHGYDPQTAYSQTFLIHDVNWLTEPLAAFPARVTIKIRHTEAYLPATLTHDATDAGAGIPAYGEADNVGKNAYAPSHNAPPSRQRYRVEADAPIHGVAPGQFCVIYDARHHRCYGSGEITL